MTIHSFYQAAERLLLDVFKRQNGLEPIAVVREKDGNITLSNLGNGLDGTDPVRTLCNLIFDAGRDAYAVAFEAQKTGGCEGEVNHMLMMFKASISGELEAHGFPIVRQGENLALDGKEELPGDVGLHFRNMYAEVPASLKN